MQGEPLFIPELERLQTLYPRAYAQGTTSTSEGAENWDMNVKLITCTHLGAAGLDSSLGVGDPTPTQPASLMGAPIYLLPVIRKSWLDGGSAYGDQEHTYLFALVSGGTLLGAETLGFGDVVRGVREVVRGAGAMENPLPPPDP